MTLKEQLERRENEPRFHPYSQMVQDACNASALATLDAVEAQLRKRGPMGLLSTKESIALSVLRAQLTTTGVIGVESAP